jgi:serine/threonine protein kinase
MLRKKREYFRKTDGSGGMAYKDQLQNVQMEIAIMKKMQHPNLVRLHEVMDDEENDKLYMGKYDIFRILIFYECDMKNCIVMDYCSNGELLLWNQKNLRFHPFVKDQEYFTEGDIRKYMRHCIRGLHYSKNITH